MVIINNKNVFCFQIEAKLRNFAKNMQILQISVHHFEYFMSCDFSKNYIATTLTKIKIF